MTNLGGTDDVTLGFHDLLNALGSYPNEDSIHQSINQSINVFNALGGNWDPTDKKFTSVNSQVCTTHTCDSLLTTT